MKKITTLLTSVTLLFSVAVGAAEVPVPVATDSRIKTFVYSENDVFSLVAHHGYQSNIEFPANEPIETISVGNKVGWQIVTAGRRLFIRPTLASARTNMTVITSKRAYQFDITAVPAVYSPEEELAYVVRFYYPDDKKNRVVPAPYSDDVSSVGKSSMLQGGAAENYKYTFSGSDVLAPQKVYDDGKSTFFKFASGVSPAIYVLDADKKEIAVEAVRSGDFWVVNKVSSQFVVRQGDDSVCVYNEN